MMPQAGATGAREENVLIQAAGCAVAIVQQLVGKIASMRVCGQELLPAPLTVKRTPTLIETEKGRRLSRAYKQTCVAMEPSAAPVDSLATGRTRSLDLTPGASCSYPMIVDFETL
jgi:hypothetical protein